MYKEFPLSKVEEQWLAKQGSTGDPAYPTYRKAIAHLRSEYQDWKRRHHWDFGSVELQDIGLGIDSRGRLFADHALKTTIEKFMDEGRRFQDATRWEESATARLKVKYFRTPKLALNFQYRLNRKYGLKSTLYTRVKEGESQMFTNMARRRNIFGVRWRLA